MAILAIAASCSVNEDAEVRTAPDIVARTETGTKTSLSVDPGGVGTIYWNPGDSITVFYGSKSTAYASQNDSDAVSATFRTRDGITIEELESASRVGLYPYDKSAICDDSSITTMISAMQNGVPSSFDRKLFITVAKADDNNLNFRNVCGGIKFTLSRGDISRVIIRGNAGEVLAGNIRINVGDESPVAEVIDDIYASKVVTLTPKSGNTFIKDCEYYIVLPPLTFSKGISLVFESGHTHGELINEKPISIKRGVFGVQNHIDETATFTDVYVDMGLPGGAKWAKCNVGAGEPEQYGDYFAWGETGSKSNYSESETYVKYNSTDGLLDLAAEDDAAYQSLGGKWRLPTLDEWTELRDNCTSEWTSVNGVSGYMLTSKINGNSIFLPAAGCAIGDTVYPGTNGYYWSSRLYGDKLEAYACNFYYVSAANKSISVGRTPRWYGGSIRPVLK